MNPLINHRRFSFDVNSILSLNDTVRALDDLASALRVRIIKLREEQARVKAAAAPKELDYLAKVAVPSSTRHGRYHTLTVGKDGSVSCSCEGYAFRETCKHEQGYKGSEAHIRQILRSAGY